MRYIISQRAAQRTSTYNIAIKHVYLMKSCDDEVRPTFAGVKAVVTANVERNASNFMLIYIREVTANSKESEL